MTEPYTPTTAEIREAWAKRNALYRSTSLARIGNRAHVATNDALYSAEDYAEFDRFMSGYVRKPSREELVAALDPSDVNVRGSGTSHAGVVLHPRQAESIADAILALLTKGLTDD